MSRIKWTKEMALRDALKYQSKFDWQKKSNKAYKAAHRFGVLTEATRHMVSLWTPKWNIDTVCRDALAYQTKSDWERNSPGAYRAAIRIKALDAATGHMDIPKKPDGYWTKANVLREALKYRTKSEWREKSNVSHAAAQQNGWTKEASGHMKSGTNSSKPERDILSILQKAHPSAKKAWFGHKKGIGNSFELDIYIPELGKGIEFNGDYFHSLEGLRRSRPTWPEEMLLKYHDIKRDFFKTKGIEYIEIWGSEWKKDRAGCLNRINEFLGPK